MRKKIFFMFAVAAFAVALAFNSMTNSSKNTISAVTLDNIEALTKGEIIVGLCTAEEYEYYCVYICGAPYGAWIAGC